MEQTLGECVIQGFHVIRAENDCQMPCKFAIKQMIVYVRKYWENAKLSQVPRKCLYIVFFSNQKVKDIQLAII